MKSIFGFFAFLCVLSLGEAPPPSSGHVRVGGGCRTPGQIWHKPFDYLVLLDTEGTGCHDYRSGLTWGPWSRQGKQKYNLEQARAFCMENGKRLPTITEARNLLAVPGSPGFPAKDLFSYLENHLEFVSVLSWFIVEKAIGEKGDVFSAFQFTENEEVRIDIAEHRKDIENRSEFLGSVVCVSSPPDKDDDFVPDASDQCHQNPAKIGFLTETEKAPVKVYTNGISNLADGTSENIKGCLPGQFTDRYYVRLALKHQEEERLTAERAESEKREREKALAAEALKKPRLLSANGIEEPSGPRLGGWASFTQSGLADTGSAVLVHYGNTVYTAEVVTPFTVQNLTWDKLSVLSSQSYADYREGLLIQFNNFILPYAANAASHTLRRRIKSEAYLLSKEFFASLSTEERSLYYTFKNPPASKIEQATSSLVEAPVVQTSPPVYYTPASTSSPSSTYVPSSSAGITYSPAGNGYPAAQQPRMYIRGPFSEAEARVADSYRRQAEQSAAGRPSGRAFGRR